MAKKFSAKLKSFDFDYTFFDGSEAKFNFRDFNTKQVRAFGDIEEMDDEERYELHLKILRENINGDEKLKEKMIAELEESGNIFEFVNMLQNELGKLKKR